MTELINSINDLFYSYLLIIILVLGGLYFTVRTKGVQFTMLGEQLRAVTEKPEDKKGVSSFGALMISTASRVGTGNIIGVSTAICLGGYGSVFWMWAIALIGGATAFVESTLAQIYKKRATGGSYGGPAYYIESGIKSRVLAVVFSLLLIITYGIGFNMLTSYNLASTFSPYGFYNEKITPWVISLILGCLVCLCLFGGGKRLIGVTEKLVPAMGIAYIFTAIVAVALNAKLLPSVLTRIFADAFDFRAIFGGLAGSSLIYGVKRGLFSNEAGVGSAPNASAAADVSHPVKQGLVQILSVFIDTVLICSATAFMCLCSGVEPTAANSGAPYVQSAASANFGAFGPIFITVSMTLFGFTTLLGNLYYVESAFDFLHGKRPDKAFNVIYYIVASLVIFIGGGLSADLLWGIADVTMGLMALINMPVIIILGKYAFRALDDYKKQRKNGLDPTFRVKDVGLSDDVECWKDGETY